MIEAMEETEQETADSEPRWKAAGPPYFLTRDELLAELEARGYSMTERQLKSWGSYGILPRPIRRMPTGAEKRVARVLYPVWMIRVLSELLENFIRGATIDQLRELAPTLIKRWEGSENSLSSISVSTLSRSGQIMPFGTGPGLTVLTAGDGTRVKAVESATVKVIEPPTIPSASTVFSPTVSLSGSVTLTVSGVVLPRISRALQRAAWEYAADFIEKNHSAVSGVTITLQLEDETEVSIEVRPPPSGDG